MNTNLSPSQNEPSTFTAPTKDWEQRMSEKKLDGGMLGWIFGSGQPAHTNIAGFAIAASFLIGGAATCVAIYKGESANMSEVWKYMTPIITGALGYLFGRTNKD